MEQAVSLKNFFFNVYDRMILFVNDKLSAFNLSLSFTRVSFAVTVAVLIVLFLLLINFINDIHIKRSLLLVFLLGFVVLFCIMLFRMSYIIY